MSKSTRFIQTPSKWTDFHLARFIYFNRAFDKSRLKGLVKWTLARFGEKKTIDLVETLKSVGYTSATQAGLSLSIDDLLIPPSKIPLITQTEAKLDHTQRRVSKGYLTSVEYLSQVITTWNVTNDVIKNQVIAHFRSKDVLNPVYMMAFSGARGNISQVRQLVGMRGLMSDPNGKIIDYAIQSNFREGLTLTEYVISCYGARKGVVDTALRTATSGYLTRRLVDVAQHVVIRLTDCSTTKGIYLTALENEEKIFMTGSSRLVGRILAEDVYDSNLGTPTLLAQRNQEVTPDLASRLFLHHKKILVRSALTCEDKNFVCQLCYGWNLSSGRLVSVGETVGVIAAQSIGEPGTQLTMRTFHTGGVFSGEISKTLQTPVYGKVSFLNSIAGKCVRTDQGEMAFLTKQSGVIYITHLDNREKKRVSKVFLKPYTILFVKQGEIVYPNQTLAEISSLDRLSQKQQSFQTIFAPLSGEIKFRTARLAQGAHYPGHTTFVPLSEHASEFWILSAQIQKFINPLKIFVQPGDRVEFKSPVLTYISLAQTETHCFDSFAFQQYVSFYRLQTLFTVLQPSSNGLLPPTSSKNAPVYGANMVTKPSILVSPSLINRGTLIERVLPFIAFFPKQRFLFRWNQSKKPKKRQSKLTTQNDRQLKAKPQVRTQQKQKLKTNFRIKHPLLFKRFSTIQCQPCERPILSVYPFAFNQKTLIAFSLTPRFVHSLSRTMFSSMFKPTRQNEVQQFVFFAIWLTRFDKQLFLSSLSSLSNSETLVLKPYKQNFHLKQPEKFVDPYLGKKPTKHPFYCPWDKLWAIFYLKKPTPDFKQPFYAVFPQGLSWNLNQELERTVTVNPRISYTHPPFCFYYRLANHFRFQPFYEILLSKTFRCEQIFEPIELVECYEFEGEVRGRRLKMAFFPKSLVFLDRINQYIQQKAFILFLKQKQEQEKEQYQRFVKNDTNPINLQPTHLPQTFDNLQLQTNSLKSLTQKTNYLQLQNGQYVTNQPMRYLNKIFAFHEFTQFPFCFDAFPTEFKKQISKPMVNTPIHYSKLSTLTYCKNSSGVKLPVACAPGFFNIPHTVPNKKLRGLTLTKTKVQIEGLSQKTILLQLLISKAQPTWNKSKKFVGLTFSLIVCLYKLFIWKHIFKKQNQLRNVYQFKNWNPTKSRSKKLVPTKNSMYCFLKKVFYKKATIRSTHIQLRRFSAQKRAWFSIKKRRQIAMTRLSIVYCLTHALPAALLFTSFRVFTYPMFSTKQKKASSIFAPMFGFCFSFLFFETRYFRHWNHVFEHQIQMKFQQQWFFQKWTQNLALLLEQKQQKQQKQRKQQRQTKSKSLYKLKGSKFMVRSFMKFWFYRRRKNLPRLFPIKVTTSSFAAYQAVDVPRVEVFLQKNYENQFLNVFRNADSELTHFSMLFLLTGYPELMGCPFFQSRFSELCYDLNQSDKISLQNESLGHYWTQKNQTILCFLKKIKKSCSKTAKTAKTTKTAKTAKIAKTAKTTKRGKAVKVDKTFKVNKALQTIKKFQYAESRNVVRLLASPFISSVSHEELWHGRHHPHLNPFGWVFFSTGLNRNFDCKLQKPGFKTGPTCQTLFAFSQETFQSMYDPWWRHQMHQLYVSSTLKCLQKQTISRSMRFTSFGRFMKHPNDFFSSYLEKSFFKQIISPNKETHVCKQSFINEIAFYTQAIRLKVKTVESLAKHDISCLNVHTLNYYVRLVFLKTAKLPLIVATKHPIRKTGLQKRLILLHLQQIYVSKNTRYRPAFVFDSLKYRKVKTKPVQTTVQFISKSPYVLSMLQKGVTHRTGDVLVKMFVQSELHHLNRVSFSGLMRPLRLQKDVQKNPPLNMSTFFHTSQLNMYQSTLLTYYFKPASWWLMSYQQLNLSATHLYVSHQFGPSGSLFTYSCAFVQTRHFGSFQHPIAKLDELVSMQKQVSTLNTGLSMVHMEKPTTITEVSQVEGFVLQCFDVTDKAKNAPSYEHDMRRFRHQPETLCSISYLTDTDMVTYQLSQPRQKLGAFISYGELVTDDCLLEESGQIIYLTKTKLVLRKAQCFLLASGSECDLNHGDLVSFGSPLLTVAYSQVESEDIIQGIPKIDQLFEARTRLGFFNLKQLLANKYEFLKKEGKQTKRDIVLESIDFIQKQIVDGVQMVYQSQGVTISDKHIEIIVKQMTSKVRVNTAIDTGFLRGDVVPFHLIEMGNFDAEDLLFECEPILLGITQAALQAEGFLSAASFQETIRILSQAAVIRKTDYLKNLKENIIVGHLLPSGTGLPSIVATKSRVNLTLPA